MKIHLSIIAIVALGHYSYISAADSHNAQNPETPLHIYNAPESWKAKQEDNFTVLPTTNPVLIFGQVNKSPDRYMGAAIHLFASGLLVTQIGCKNRECFESLQAKLCAEISDEKLRIAQKDPLELLLQDNLSACQKQSLLNQGDALSFLWYAQKGKGQKAEPSIIKFHYNPPSHLDSTTCGVTGGNFPLIHLCGILKHPFAMDLSVQYGTQLRKKAQNKKLADIAPLVTDVLKQSSTTEASFIMVDLQALAVTIAKQTKTATP